MREAAVSPEHARPSRSRVRLTCLIAATALVGCEFPTELPLIDTRWVVPAEETRFGVAELLPGEVTLTPDEGAFLVDFDPVTFSANLGSLCAACIAANGLTVPKPPFIDGFESDIDFPTEVSAVTIVSGQVQIAIQNGLNFDPLRPTAGMFGEITITIEDSADGDVLGTLVIDGAATAMTAGATLNRTLDLGAGTVNGGLLTTVDVTSPAGDPVTINTSLQISATATPTNVVVSSVAIDVGGRSVDLDPVDLDVEDIDSDISDRVQEGAFVLHVTNPFSVGASIQITIDGPGIVPIQKAANIGAATSSTVTLSLTAAEIQSFLGRSNVVLTGGAVIDPAAPIISVTPGQELVLSGDLDLTLRIGG
jgi:hypothetical protein